MPHYERSTALIVVDLQNDFADPSGSLPVRGGAAIVPFVNTEIADALEAGAFVVYTQDWHPRHTPHFAQDGGVWPVHCVQNTWGARLHPDLAIEGPVVRKGTFGEDGYSGFTMRDPVSEETIPTELAGLLLERAVTRVVVTGLATDYCVRATALDATALSFETTVLAAGIAAVNLKPGDGERALEEMAAAGVHIEPARH